MSTTTRARPSAPAIFDMAYDAVAGDDRCRRAAEGIRAHAVEVACLSRELAPLVDADPGAAYSAGLLHDVGQLLLLRRDPGGYLALLTDGLAHGDQLQREKELYGTDHALLAAEHLLDQRVADAVADAVADHHDPFVSSAATTVVVSAADELLGSDASRRRSVRLLDVDGNSLRRPRTP
jgi:putative nucleotidyltransferase with HDIG domain